MGKTKVVNRLPQFIAKQEIKGRRAIAQALLIGGSHAAGYIPRVTGNLVNSKFDSIRVLPGRIVGTLGFTAEYALAVHEAIGKLKGMPRPMRDGKGQGVYWGPGGEPQFLRKGFEEAQPLILAAIKGELKV